jgi:hypothetical protein
MALAAEQQLEPAVHETLTVHSLADAGFVHEVDGDLLEDAGADPAKHILAGLSLEDYVVNAGPVQQLAEQQAGWAGTDDGDLGSGRYHSSLLAGGTGHYM